MKIISELEFENWARAWASSFDIVDRGLQMTMLQYSTLHIKLTKIYRFPLNPLL
jgi:hypothetical protein